MVFYKISLQKKEQQKPEANSKKFTDEIHCNSPARVIAFTTNNSDSAQGRNPKNLNVQFHLHGLEPEEESDVEYDNNVGYKIINLMGNNVLVINA